MHKMLPLHSAYAQAKEKEGVMSRAAQIPLPNEAKARGVEGAILRMSSSPVQININIYHLLLFRVSPSSLFIKRIFLTESIKCQRRIISHV